MPTVSALLSGGVSVGLLAGVVSGLFYLVVAGIRWAGEVKQQSGEWFYRQVQQRFHPALAAPPESAEENGGGGMEAGSAQVRDFIERLVEALVAGDLDNVCIRRLHAHPDYKPMAGQESPSAAHAALKLLIQEIIQEAQTLPDFKGLHYRGEDDGQLLEDMESKTYEDILATAILNKVIERYQQTSAAGKNVDGNSNLLSPELMSLVAAHKPKFISSVKIGVNSPTSSDDGKMFTSDVDSLSDVSHTDPLSVTIEECIEEVTTFSNVEDEAEDLPGLDVFKNRRAPFPEYGRDIVDGPPLDMQNDTDEDENNDELEEDPSLQPTDMINPVDSWEENWLFQKRRLKVGGVPQPMSVPMLVPNPSEDYRALIGDRDAEDVSDLSECSDGALEDLVLADEDIPAEVPVNEMSAKDTTEECLVPGLNGVSSLTGSPEIELKPHENEDGEEKPIIPASETVNGNLLFDEADLNEAKNFEFLKTSEDCLSEFGQQEGEYTEDYAAVTQRQLDSLIGLTEPESSEIPELPTSPIPQKSPDASDVDEAVVAILDKLVPSENTSDESPGVCVELANPPRPGTELSDDEHLSQHAPGTIAEREHKKWESAPPLPNNPYSPENIYKRLSKKTPFSRMSSNSDISLEFPELKDSPTPENIIDKPLQIICSPSEVDHKKYGRDYYINAQPTDSKNDQRNSSEHHQVSVAANLAVAGLEEQILSRDIYHSSFRARNASPQFKMNPIYEKEKEETQREPISQRMDNKQVSACFDENNSNYFNSSQPIPQSVNFHLSFDKCFGEAECYDKTIPAIEISSHNSEKEFQAQTRTHTPQFRDKVCIESGYSSSLDSLNDPSTYMLRLTPPSQPQMVERTFESLKSIRRSASLRVSTRKRKVASPVLGGSLRLCRRQTHSLNDLW